MKSQSKAYWKNLWSERGRAVRDIMGESVPPGYVRPFSWKDRALPGACSVCYGPSANSDFYTYMTLGLTQPVEEGDRVSPWEFCIIAKEYSHWPHELLYDLVTFWLDDDQPIERGLYLPLTYFQNRAGELCVGLTEDRTDLEVVGAITGLLLWNDRRQLRFSISSGDFNLMTAIPITQEEDQLAMETTPPHLLLMLEKMGIQQISDPFRESVMDLPGAGQEWQRIRELSHDEAVSKLQKAASDAGG